MSGSNLEDENQDPFGLGKKPAGRSVRVVLDDTNLFMEQANRDANSYQFERELVMNSLDAKATEIHVTPDWVEVSKSGIYRYTIIDNGCGMSREVLRERCRTLIQTNRPEHFGVGGRISTLPISPLGVIFMSCQDGNWNMIRLWKDPDDENKPKLFTWEIDTTGSTDVIEDVSDEYKKMAADHGINDGHGTMVILIGSKADQDTFRDLVRDETGEFIGGARTHTVVLNTRFADIQKLAPNTKISCVEFSGVDKSKWPRTYEQRHTPTDLGDGKKKLLMARSIRGFMPYVRELAETSGVTKVGAKYNGKECFADVHWFIFYDEDKIPENVPNKDPHAFLGGDHRATTALIFKGELYSLDSHPERLRKFGLYVQGSNLHKKIAIFVEPTEGALPHNDFSRSHLRWEYKAGDDGLGPQLDWAQAFKNDLPAPLRALKDEALNTLTGASNVEEMLRDELTPILEAYLAQRLIHGRGLRKRRGSKKEPWPASNGDGTNDPPPPPGNNGEGDKADVIDITTTAREKFIPQIKWAHLGEDKLAANYDPDNRLLVLNADFPMFNEYKVHALEKHGHKMDERLIFRAVEDAYARRIGSAYVVGYFRHKYAKHIDGDMLKAIISDEAGTLVACDVLGMFDAIELMLGIKPAKYKKAKSG